MSPQDQHQSTDERLARDATQLLRQSVEELDAATLSRLNQARQKALAEIDGRRHARLSGIGWRPALGAMAVAMVAVGLWLGRGSPGAPGAGPDASAPLPVAARIERAAELELMLADESLEMIEDLEFYDWLESDLAAEDGLSPELSG